MSWKLMQTFVLFLGTLFLTFPAQAVQETYTIDPLHSHVSWQGDNFGISHPSGEWFAKGTVQLDEDNPAHSKVNATIHLAELVTGIPELDKYLKDKRLLIIDHFPVATFVSNKVDAYAKDKAKIHGTLTVHGVTKPVTLQVILNKTGLNSNKDKTIVGFSGVVTLKRSDFNINTLLPGVGDDVKFHIQVEAYKSVTIL